MKSICCAGAIGIYPNSIDDIHEENSPLSQENFFTKSNLCMGARIRGFIQKLHKFINF